MKTSAWVALYFFLVFLDGSVSLIEEMLPPGVPTFVLSVVAFFVSLPVLVLALRGSVAPRALLAATAGMEVVACLAPVLALFAGLRVSLAVLRVVSYVPLTLLAFTGLTQAEPIGALAGTTLARVSLVWALTSAMVVALTFPGGGYAFTDVAALAALCGAGLGIVAVFAAKGAKPRLHAAIGFLVNLLIALGWRMVRF